MNELEAKSISSVDEIGEAQWNSLIQQSDFGTVYQCYGFMKAYEEGYSGESAHFIVMKDRNIVAALPGVVEKTGLRKKLASIGAGSGSIITTSDRETATELLIEEAERFCKSHRISKHTISAELQKNLGYNSLLTEKSYSSKYWLTNSYIDLTKGLDHIKKQMKRSKRRSFDKLIDDRDVNIFEPSRENLIEFYGNYKNFQKREGVRNKQIDFFTELSRIKEKLRIAEYRTENGLSTQQLFVIDKDRSKLESLLTGKGEHYDNKGSETVHANTINWASEKFDIYSFGTSEADFRNGIYKFKSEFGAQQKPVLRWEKSYSLLDRLR